MAGRTKQGESPVNGPGFAIPKPFSPVTTGTLGGQPVKLNKQERGGSLERAYGPFRAPAEQVNTLPRQRKG